MKAPRFPLIITFVTSKEDTSGIIQVMPLSASPQLWKPQAKKHTSFSIIHKSEKSLISCWITDVRSVLRLDYNYQGPVSMFWIGRVSLCEYKPN